VFPRTATEEGVRAASRATRKEQRYGAGHGQMRTNWYRPGSGRTEGPQNSWLHQIGKASNAGCPCGHPGEDGHNITFTRLRFTKEGHEFVGAKSTWEELDAPDWRKEGDDGLYNAIEAFFSFIYHEIS